MVNGRQIWGKTVFYGDVWRAGANENTTIPGMGIGLPMARTLLTAAGAELTIEDPADGVGARMLIRFW